MTQKIQRYKAVYDLTNCEAEPLRFIRSCQANAVIIVLYADTLRIKAISQNAGDRYDRPLEDLLGADAGAVLDKQILATLKSLEAETDLDALNPMELITGGQQNKAYRRENLIVHREGDLLILEIEPRDDNYGSTSYLMRIDKAMASIQAGVANDSGILDTIVREVRALTGFDRVCLYRFDEEYNGEVVAEMRHAGRDAFLNLRYPHTDIPKQARDLYLKQQIRHITSTRAESDFILLADDDAPINLQQAYNRGVSPIHLEYLRAMEVGASMSIAVVVNNKLWGLIACHHEKERLIDFRLRRLLGFFGRILSGHIALHQGGAYQQEMLSANLLRAAIIERMKSSDDLLQPLLADQGDLLKLLDASSGALVLDGTITRLGESPTESEVTQLLEFVAEKEENVFSTPRLHELFPDSRNFQGSPAGMVSIRLTKKPGEYIMWFRPEIVKTINWGGNPKTRKVIEDSRVRMHPELSFTRYTETKRGESKAWERHQLDNALALRNDIKEVILGRFLEMRKVNSQLTHAYEELETFSYSVSHDLRAPLRHIKGFAEILEEDYGEQLDNYGQQALATIVTSVNRMNEFINGILSFSKLGKAAMIAEQVDLRQVVYTIFDSIPEHTDVELKLDLRQPKVPGDATLFSQLFLNLIGNAIKYRRKKIASTITITSSLDSDHVRIEVADNGIGFDMKYADQIFTVFNRLVKEEEYEGTGVGLAIVKRIIEKHAGQISVNSQPGVGTVFTLLIPQDLPERLRQAAEAEAAA